MRLSTSLSILVSVGLLTSCGRGGGGTTAARHILAQLQCNGPNNPVNVGYLKDTVVTFSVPAKCAPLKMITPDPPGHGFDHKDTSNGTISYTFDGRNLPADGYKFSYSPTGVDEHGLANNGTGTIKN
jgi:hypothetical protein